MKAESKVVSLETAKKLFSGGFSQVTERYWAIYGAYNPELHTKYPMGADLVFAAPDAQEIGELLPVTTWKAYSPKYTLEIEKTEDGWVVRYRCDKDSFLNQGWKDKNEAEACAEAWLWLEKNKLI